MLTSTSTACLLLREGACPLVVTSSYILHSLTPYISRIHPPNTNLKMEMKTGAFFPSLPGAPEAQSLQNAPAARRRVRAFHELSELSLAVGLCELDEDILCGLPILLLA